MRRSTVRSSWASTGSTPPRSTASGIRKRSSAARSTEPPRARTFSRKRGSPRVPGGRPSRPFAEIRRAGNGLERLGDGRARSLADPLAEPGRGDRGGLVDASPRRKEEGLVRHIGVSQLRYRAAPPRAGDRTGRDTAVELLPRRPGPRAGHPPVLRTRGDRSHRVFADGIGPPDGDHAPREGGKHCRTTTGASAIRASATPGTMQSPGASQRSPNGTGWSGAVAVAWTLRNAAVDAAIVGFRRPNQVDPILSALQVELGDKDVAERGLEAAAAGAGARGGDAVRLRLELVRERLEARAPRRGRARRRAAGRRARDCAAAAGPWR